MEAIARTTTDATQAATRKLYAGFWTNSQHKTTVPAPVAISASLLHLAETLERNLSKNALATYLAVLADLSQEQIVLAFSRAAMECKHFPVPALLRDFASIGEPVAAEAKQELIRIIQAMRGAHGPKLKPILGKLKYGTENCPRNAKGEIVAYCDAERAPSTLFPLSRRAEAALVRLGWGDRTTGIALIAESPIVSGGTAEDGEFQTNRLRAGDELLAKWTAAYREVA
jgi:hypothetical protein